MERSQKTKKQRLEKPKEEQQALLEPGPAPEKSLDTVEKSASCIEIVRNSTPRPHSLEGLTNSEYMRAIQGEEANIFPTKAPSAPPLPEELNGEEEERVESGNTPVTTPRPGATEPLAAEEDAEFAWLFEYGLEMDPIVLNSPERLDGQALLYGPAVLKGYTMMLGKPLAGEKEETLTVAIQPAPEPDEEVWGVLYRIPRRLAGQKTEEPALLDTVHGAIPPHHFFQGEQVVVHESYRSREIATITYMATEIAGQRFQLVAAYEWHGEDADVARLAEIARQQKLPEHYIQQTFVATKSTPEQQEEQKTAEISAEARAVDELVPMGQAIPFLEIPPSVLPPSSAAEAAVGVFMRGEVGTIYDEQDKDTDPLPALKQRLLTSLPETQVPPLKKVLTHQDQDAFAEQKSAAPQQKQAKPILQGSRWLFAFSLYLATLLLTVLTFAVLQGLGWGNGILTGQFAPLGVPWLVLIYGLLGGCLSCLITLARLRISSPPAFVVVTWFTRPFIGAVLASFVFIFLTSGLFALGGSLESYASLFSLAGAAAGLCEALIFLQWRR